MGSGHTLRRTTKITAMAAQRPHSPTHILCPSVEISKAPMTAFHTECAQIQGQMLPEERRSQAKTKAAAMMSIAKNITDNVGCGREACCSPRISGTVPEQSEQF